MGALLAVLGVHGDILARVRARARARLGNELRCLVRVRVRVRVTVTVRVRVRFGVELRRLELLRERGDLGLQG